ncbi:MAG: zinc finger domain-containing protein, partial [Gammaproteobacteria bacterium]
LVPRALQFAVHLGLELHRERPEITPKHRIARQLAQLGEELRFVLITSTASIAPLESAPADAATAEMPGLRLIVRPAAGSKCVRCWHRREDVGSHAAHPELCGRCTSNVDGPGERRAHA